MHRVLFLGEGPSDDGIRIHIERMAVECGVEISLTAPNAEMLPTTERSVTGKLNAIRKLGGSYELVFIHRDADGAGREARVSEIAAGVNAAMSGVACVPVVPVRMTEAWLLLDEGLIREVAGNPNGRVKLNIPTAREAERMADPKAFLKDLITTASETTGRRRRELINAFSFARRRLLEELDPNGMVGQLESWRRFVSDAVVALHGLERDDVPFTAPTARRR